MNTDEEKEKDSTSWSDEIYDLGNVTYSQLNAAESINQEAQQMMPTTAAAEGSRMQNHSPERSNLMESVRYSDREDNSVPNEDSLDDQTVTVLTEMQRALQNRVEYPKSELQQILDDPIAESMVGMSRFATITSTTKVRLLALAKLITRDWATHPGKFSIAYALNLN